MDPDYTLEREGLGPDVDLRVMTCPERGPMDGAEAKDADAIMTWRTRIDEEAIERAVGILYYLNIGKGNRPSSARARRRLQSLRIYFCTPSSDKKIITLI